MAGTDVDEDSHLASAISIGRKIKTPGGCTGHYESIRSKRIKENQERLEQLGLINRLKGSELPADGRRRKQPESAGPCRKRSADVAWSVVVHDVHDAPKTLQPLRRSLRLQNLATETDHEQESSTTTTKKIEFYTEEDEKLLGGCEKSEA